MNNKYLIFAMSRSGHHAIINWMMDNTESTVKHFNNCIRGWEDGKILPLNNKINIKKGNHSTIEIFNIEDMDLQYYSSIPDKEKYTIIFIIRDPLNWIASSLKNGGHTASNLNKKWKDETGKIRESRINIYKSHYDEIIGESNLIINKKIISYNEWFLNENYRQKKSKELFLDHYNNGLNKLSNWGGGSSFDKNKFENNASKMKVIDRWKAYKNDKNFTTLLDDDIIKIKENFNLI